MRKAALAIFLIGLLAAFSLGCIQHEGQLALFMTNAATNQQSTEMIAQQVNVEIISVEVLEPSSRAFITLSNTSQVHEVLGLGTRGSLLALADSLTEGNYREVRITFSEARSSVVDNRGRRLPLIISPKTVTVPSLFTVVEDTATDVVLELDLEASLNLRANGNWLLRPVFRHVPPVVR